MLLPIWIGLMVLLFGGVTFVTVRDEIKFKGNVPANYRFTIQLFTVVFALGGTFIVIVVKG